MKNNINKVQAKNNKVKAKNNKVQIKNNKAKINKIEKSKTIAILIILVGIILFGIYKTVVFIQNPADTFSLEQGNIYQEERSVGYIIREETIVKGNNYKNGMEQKKSEGERVAKGEAIFRYYSNGEENLVKKIQDLDQKIEEALENENQYPTSDVKALEKQIEDKIVSLYKVNEMQIITQAKKEISDNITKKAKIAGEYSPAGSYLKKLINERSSYENQLNEGAEYLTAPISGVVSYKVDGYEDVLTPKDFSKLSTDFLENLNLKVGQVVADSKEVAKIINNFECYIACTLDSKQAKEAKVGNKVQLRLPNDVEISSKIEYMLEEDGKVLIVFSIDKQVQELISYRKISFDIIWWSFNGKKVPNEAIAYEQKGENQIPYVVRTRAGYESKIYVKILKSNEKYTIIDNCTNTELKELGYTSEELQGRGLLTLYDEILRKPT